jgi:hypothetical protein
MNMPNITNMGYFSFLTPIKRISFEDMKNIIEKNDKIFKYLYSHIVPVPSNNERSKDVFFDNNDKYLLEKKIIKYLSDNTNNGTTSFVWNFFDESYTSQEGGMQSRNDNKRIFIINTLTPDEQECLIQHTFPFTEEENLMNTIIENNYTNRVTIIIYGRNCNDETAEKKYKQLTNLGFQNVHLYTGGLFEWVLLQDVYGKEEFQTTSVVADILRFSPIKNLGASRR